MDFEEDTREDEEEEQYKFGRIWRDPTDKCYERVKQLYDKFGNMTKTEYVKSTIAQLKFQSYILVLVLTQLVQLFTFSFISTLFAFIRFILDLLKIPKY